MTILEVNESARRENEKRLDLAASICVRFRESGVYAVKEVHSKQNLDSCRRFDVMIACHVYIEAYGGNRRVWPPCLKVEVMEVRIGLILIAPSLLKRGCLKVSIL